MDVFTINASERDNYAQIIKEVIELREIAFDREISCEINDQGEDIDIYYDLIVVLDKGYPVGTYRIQLVSENNIDRISNSKFYHLDFFINQGKRGADLGRAAVHPGYRDGKVIKKLWKGIADYINENNIDYVFGSSSVLCEDVEKDGYDIARNIIQYINDKNILSDIPVFPKEQYTRKMSSYWPHDSYECDKKQIPALFKGYARAGARFRAEPCFDIDFGSIDFFTVFESKSITDRYSKKFKM